MTYTWQLSDGTTGAQTFYTGSSFTKSYANGGAFFISLTGSVASPSPCTDTANITEYITGPVNCAGTILNILAYGTGASRSFTVGGFGYISSGYTLTDSFSYGDGTSGILNSHAYSANGTYTVTCTRTASHPTYGTCAKTASTTVTITGITTLPTLNCATTHASFTSANTGGSYTFTSTSTPTTLPNGVSRQLIWNFGNGTTSTSNTGYTYYSANGTYNVKLKVNWVATSTGTVLCTDSITTPITVTSAPNTISGYVHFDSMLVTGYYPNIRFWLIQYDSATQMLTAVDSQTIQTSAVGYSSYCNYSFTGKPAGQYLLKAHIINQPSTAAVGLLPTYADSSLFWNTAGIVYHNGGATYRSWNLKQGTPVSGNGFIGGSVIAGANKGTAAGDPVANQLVLLRNTNGQVLRSTYTNALGNYSFANIPTGQYTIYPEEMNFVTTPSNTLTVSGFENTKNGINFRKSSGDQTIVPFIATGIIPVEGIGIFLTTPNPSTGRVVIAAPGNAGTYQFSVTSVTGQVVYHSDKLTTTNTVNEINLSHLTPGVYTVTFESARGTEHQKLVIQR
jgi:hypothetical protein